MITSYQVIRPYIMIGIILIGLFGVMPKTNETFAWVNAHVVEAVIQPDYSLLSLLSEHIEPSHIVAEKHTRPLKPIEQDHVGRYSLILSCEDLFARCEHHVFENVEFILNLLPNGIVYRSNIYLGKMATSDRSKIHQAYWYYEEQTDRIVLERLTGEKFFMYPKNEQGELIMDFSRIVEDRNNRNLTLAEKPVKAYKYIYID